MHTAAPSSISFPPQQRQGEETAAPKSSLRTSLERRTAKLLEIRANPKAIPIELELCKRSVLHWFDHWAWTYNPKLATQAGEIPHRPFDLFPRQREMLKWLEARVTAREDGLLEKSRDIGFTYGAGGFALHRWLFVPGFKTT